MEQNNVAEKRSVVSVPFAIMFAAVVIGGAVVYDRDENLTRQPGLSTEEIAQGTSVENKADTLEAKVLPAGGFELPVEWGDLGRRLVEYGVIDRAKFLEIYEDRGGLTDDEARLLDGMTRGNLRITQQNAGILLNLLWAFGLANKNPVLTEGPMVDPDYGGADRFASTGGWTIAVGDAMDHYAKHELVILTDAQQKMVERVAKGVFRPCCGNSTYFPDCNHGMAMLGLLELLAAQGADEDAMYKSALAINSFWFPDTYLTIAQYKAKRGVDWSRVNAREVLGADYSSGAGFRRIQQEIVAPARRSGGGSCGV